MSAHAQAHEHTHNASFANPKLALSYPTLSPWHVRFQNSQVRSRYPSGEHRGAYVPLAGRTKFRAGWEAAIAHKGLGLINPVSAPEG
jgi:hypothetical protein